MMESRFVFLICRRRGESTSATREVEKSISRRDMLPSRVSKHLAKGSVVKMRKPREVPVVISKRDLTFVLYTYRQPDGCSPG